MIKEYNRDKYLVFNKGKKKYRLRFDGTTNTYRDKDGMCYFRCGLSVIFKSANEKTIQNIMDYTTKFFGEHFEELPLEINYPDYMVTKRVLYDVK